MALSFQHNADGTITVTSDNDSLTFLPRGDVVRTTLEGSATGSSASEGDDDANAGISVDADSDDGGATPPPPPPRRPKRTVGWPMPESMGFVAGQSLPAKRSPPINLRVFFDPATRTITPARDFDAHLFYYQKENNTGPGDVIPVAIVTRPNQSVELAAIRAQLPRLSRMVGNPILPVLTAPRDGEDLF